MARLKKYVYIGFAAIIMFLALAMRGNASDSNAITVFVGPQSLTPNEIISVTVQTPQRRGRLFETEQVELIYTADGKINTLTGTPIHGLVSFDIPAQDQAGIMKFTARTLELISNEALVSVVPGSPESLPLTVNRSHQVGMVEISSSVITDTHGNTVSDQSLVTIQWIDETGLVKSQNAQLLNGRVYTEASCPSEFSGELKIRAVLKKIQFLSSDLSVSCVLGSG